MDVASFLGGNFLTHVDLPNPVQNWTIRKVDQQMVGQGPNAEQKICVAFNEFPTKPLALNKTNIKRLAALYGTDANNWLTKQLLIYRSTTTFASETKLCVRVCGPQQAPPDAICDQQGNAVPMQNAGMVQASQPAAPQAQPVAPPQPQVAQPAAQPIAPPTQQPVAAAPQQTPWEQNDNGPASA